VFTVKRNKEGEIDRCKARLVVKGCAQKWGKDYTETYSPVASFVSPRVLLAIINRNNLCAHQLDVKNSFLHGELKDELYMKIPEGIENCKNKVCTLRKSLYGLKQAPAVWNKNFVEYMSCINKILKVVWNEKLRRGVGRSNFSYSWPTSARQQLDKQWLLGNVFQQCYSV
jgi:hypothetical protein